MNEHFKSAIWAVVIIAVMAFVLTMHLNTVQDKLAAVMMHKSEVNLTCADGIKLSADLYEPAIGVEPSQRRYPGLVLLSPFLESRHIYTGFTEELCRMGMVVLSVDVRNSGDSSTNGSDVAGSVAHLGLDAAAAVDYLAGHARVMPDNLAILGTAITARSALLAAQDKDNIRATILISAVLDSAGMDIIKRSSELPILVLVSIMDGPAGSQARAIYEASQNPKSRIESYINAGAGSDLWRTRSRFDMTSAITDWLDDVLLIPSEP